MAVQEAGSAPTPGAQVVANAFVEQYYHILHQSPGLVHRFYQDSSVLGRPDVSGNITTVKTTQAINEKILSLNYEDYTAEIETADAQESYGNGVIVLVTGCLTGKDHVRRKFTQTFFLAPQEKGYFVLNDVFRFLEENEPIPIHSTANNGISNATATAALPLEQEPAKVPDELAAKLSTPLVEEEELNNGPEILIPSGNGGCVIEDKAIESTPHKIDSCLASEEDAPKKSYASIVKVMQGHAVTGKVTVPSKMERTPPPPASDTQQLSKKASVITPNPSTDIAPESSDVHEEAAEGRSIFIRNLPFDATVEQLEEEFKKFGPIKSNGIQVRSSKQGSCFGFIEFETSSSRGSALKASPITIGDHRALIEEKRTTTQVANSGRGRYSLGRGGFRNDSFRGRRNFGGGRGYGRNDFRNQGEFSPRGPMGRGGDGYQRAYQNGNAKGSREGAN